MEKTGKSKIQKKKPKSQLTAKKNADIPGIPYADDRGITRTKQVDLFTTKLLVVIDEMEVQFIKWKVTINVEKSTTLIKNGRTNQYWRTDPQEKTKYFGVETDRGLTITFHVNNIINKVKYAKMKIYYQKLLASR